MLNHQTQHYANLRNPKSSMGSRNTYRRLFNTFTRSFPSNRNAENVPKSVPTMKNHKPPLMAIQSLKRGKIDGEKLTQCDFHAFLMPNLRSPRLPTVFGRKPSPILSKTWQNNAKLSPKNGLKTLLKTDLSVIKCRFIGHTDLSVIPIYRSL